MCVECVSNTRMTENEIIVKIHITYTKATNGHFYCNLILIIVVYWRAMQKKTGKVVVGSDRRLMEFSVGDCGIYMKRIAGILI